MINGKELVRRIGISGSISKKIVTSFVLILFLSLSIVGFTFFNNQKMKDMYGQLLDISILYNDLYTTFEQTSAVLKKCAETSDPQDCRQFAQTYPALLDAGNRLNETLNPDHTIRSVTDLNYMIQTYVETGMVMVDDIANKEYLDAVEKVNDVRNLEELVGSQYNRIYSEVIDYSLKAEADAEQFYRNMTVLNIALLIACILICAFFIRYTASVITRPIKKLQKAALAFSLGEQGPQGFDKLDIHSNDEIGVLADAFIKMQNKINQQYALSLTNAELQRKLDEDEVKILRTEKLMKESQLKALQAQINPHFLFNTLNMIANMAYFENAGQTAVLMESLGSLMRYNLDNFNKKVSVKDEISSVEDFITIQQKRFGDRIAFRVELESEAENGIIPCLIIQPLLENAIVHGVNMYTDGGEIGVSVKRMAQRIIITVFDNGVGMDQERLEKVRAIAQNGTDEIESDSIGLSNVFERLLLFYGDDVRINIASNPGIYTEICINIPFVEQGG